MSEEQSDEESPLTTEVFLAKPRFFAPLGRSERDVRVGTAGKRKPLKCATLEAFFDSQSDNLRLKIENILSDK